MFDGLLNYKIKVRNILFIMLIIVFCLTASDTAAVSGSMYKYIILVLCIIEAFWGYKKKIRKDGYNPKMKKEFITLMIFAGVVVFYSIIKALITEHFSIRPIQEILFLICPMIYAYLAINYFSQDEIEKNMKKAIIISFVLYIMSLELNFNAIIQAITDSNFSESTSSLESGVYSGLASAFCVFFCYFDKNKIFKYLSILFVIMTFKRFQIIVAVILLAISILKVKDKKIPKKTYLMIAVFIFIFSVVYYNIMLPVNVKKIERSFGIDVSKITMTRSDRMSWLYYSNFESYGFGSSTEYMYEKFNGALEMDLVKIIVELGYFPVLFLIISYMYTSRGNLYTFVYMSLKVIGMTFSSNMTTSISWTIVFLTIFLINKKGSDKENVSIDYNTSI